MAYLGTFCFSHTEAYSKTLQIGLRVYGNLKPRLTYLSAYVSGIFSHIHNVRHIEVYLPTFGYILADSGIFKILAQLDVLMYVKVYSEPIQNIL